MSEGSSGMNLVHLSTVPYSLTFIQGQPAYFRERGIETLVITSPGVELDAFGASEQVQTRPVPMSREISPLSDIISLARLVRVFLASRPEIVHAQTPKAGLLGMAAAWITRRPVRVYSMLGLRYATTRGRRRRLLQAMERLTCFFATSVVCVSHSLRDMAVADRLVPENKVHVLAGGSVNGIDADRSFARSALPPSARQDQRSSLGISPDALVAGFIGRVVLDKGITELAQAWTTIRESHPNAHLIVAGPEEAGDPVSPDTIAQLRRDPRVHLVGSVIDPRTWYAAFDLFVLPTYREGFPNVILEASAMELPVVTTTVPGCVDAVVDTVTGTLVPVRDAAALAEAIARYLDNPALREQHGKAGRDRVVADFRQEVIWEAIRQEYGRLLAERGIQMPSHDPT